MLTELPVDMVICNCVCPEILCYTTVRVCLTDWAEQPELFHQATDLFQVHTDTFMEQPHVDAAGTFGITTVIVSLQNPLKISHVLFFTQLACTFATDPVIVTGARYACKFTQSFYGKSVETFLNLITNKTENKGSCAYFSRDWIFFKNSIVCSSSMTLS